MYHQQFLYHSEHFVQRKNLSDVDKLNRRILMDMQLITITDHLLLVKSIQSEREWFHQPKKQGSIDLFLHMVLFPIHHITGH